MNTLRLPVLLLLAVAFFAVNLNGQNALAVNNNPAVFTASKNAPSPNSSSFRFHKKLSPSYEGYAIEVAASNYPLDRTNPIFRQFGNVQYDKLDTGGYSYLILGDFSSEESAFHFLKSTVINRAEEARLIHYKDGNRKVIRED